MKKARRRGQNESIEDSVAVSVDQETSICRGCLVTERRMVNAMLFEASFKDLTGITISPTDGLPQWLCYECSALLRKCVTFRNKVMKSHYRLCQYLLESVPITIDEDATPHLSRTSVLHCHIAGTQTDKLEEQIDDTIKYGTGTFCETVKVEDEPMFSDSEDNIVEEEYREEIPEIQLASSLLTCDPLDINSVVTVKHEEQAEEGEVEERCLPDVSDKPVDVKQETVEVKEEPLHDCDAITEEWREPSPFTGELWRSRPVKCYTKKKRTMMPKTEVQTEQTEKRLDLLGTQAARVESLVVTEEEGHSLRARLRFDDDIYTHEPEQTTLTTPINIYEDTPDGGIQEHFLEHGFMKFEVENPSDRVNYNCNYEIYSESHKDYDKCDATSLHDSDDAEENVKYNLFRDSSVNSSSRCNVQSNICDTCNKCFSNKNLLTEHIREHSAEKSFKCDVFYKNFPDDSTLTKPSRVHSAAKLYQCDVQHLRKHSNEKLYSGDVSDKRTKREANFTTIRTGNKPLKCDVCMKGFSFKSDLNIHMRMHTGEKLSKCKVCMRYFGQEDTLHKHMRMHTSDKPYKCDVCLKCFSQKVNLNRHMRVHTGDKPYKCDVCMKCFSQKFTLSNHMRVHTSDKPYKCDVCLKCFSQEVNLNKHMRVHTGDKPYKCDVCMKCFIQKFSLSNHMRVHTSDKPYKCDVCLKCFSQKVHLSSHMRVHTGDKPYKCDVCMKCFGQKVNLNKHMRVHTGDKPYKCDVCMKCFSQKFTLSNHMRVHTGDKPYKCDVCIKCFGQKVSLNNHMRVHTGDKQYKCDVCMKCFGNKSHLMRHMRMHTGDKPYRCDVCMKCFCQKNHLIRHMRLHTGEKPYKCDLCMKCFAQKCALNTHMRVHTGDKPYKCDVCLKHFTQKSSLSSHIRTHTGNKPSAASKV